MSVVRAEDFANVRGRRRAECKVGVTANGQEFLVGNGTVSTHEIYDPATNKGSGKELPYPPRDPVGIAVLGGKIHLSGGRAEGAAQNLDKHAAQNLDKHDVYDPSMDTRTDAAPLPRARSAAAFTVLDGLILSMLAASASREVVRPRRTRSRTSRLRRQNQCMDNTEPDAPRPARLCPRRIRWSPRSTGRRHDRQGCVFCRRFSRMRHRQFSGSVRAEPPVSKRRSGLLGLHEPEHADVATQLV
jgi:hypothetical protein